MGFRCSYLKIFFCYFRTPENVFKSKLRKCPVMRSPHGTPLVNNELNLSSGVGLTPLLSNALKKKFYVRINRFIVFLMSA